MISKKARALIKTRLQDLKLYLKYRAIGPQALTNSELKQLMRSGIIKISSGKITAPVIEAYLKTHEQSVVDDVAPKSQREGAINYLETMMGRYAEKSANELGAQIESTIESNLMPFKNLEEGRLVSEALKDTGMDANKMRKELQGKIDNWEYRWRTVVATEINRASNWGAMDAIIHNNKGMAPEQITVYKQGNKPGHGACKYCSKFWYLEDGVTPRVYKLSELMANGSNIGKKAKDWLPTIDSTHPQESHMIRELAPGYGFVGGTVEHIGKDHDEYKKQRGQS